MAVKRDQPPQEEPNYEEIEDIEDTEDTEDTDDTEDASVEVEEQPTKEEVENLEQKIAANTQDLNTISEALAQSMLISVIMATYCPPNSEIQEKINVSNDAIAACIEEAAEIAAVLDYIKEELKQFKNE